MAEEAVVQQEMTYADALKNSLNPDYTAVPTPIETPVVQTPSEITETPALPATPAFDPIAYLKETFGEEYADPQVIKSKITAPAPEPIVKQPEFTNDVSKSIYENLLAGNKKEVREYLQKIELAETISTKSPAEIIKAGWKEEYDLNDAQVERRFNKTYSIPDAELMEPEDKEIEQKLIDKQIQKEAEKYKDFFGKYTTELSLPSLEQKPAPASAPQPESEEAKKANLYAIELNKTLPTDFSKIGYEFNDEKAGLKFSGHIPIPEKEVANIKTQLSGHEDKFLAARWFNQDGSAKEDLIASDIYYLVNRDKLLNEGIVDAVRQTRIELHKQNRNYQEPGATVIAGDFEPSENEKKSAWYKKNFM